MAFFDDIGRAISDATQSVAQKSRDFSDANKYNSMISNEEKAIAYAYGELGRLYIEKYEGKYNEEMLELVNSVKESQLRIEDYRSRVQVLKNIQVCPQCGLELKRTDFFCPSCGFRMPEPVQQMPPMGMQGYDSAPNGMQMQPYMNQNQMQMGPAPTQTPAEPNSGTPTSEVPTQGSEASVDSNPAQSGETVYCSNCGAVVEAGNKYCMTCGTPV